MKKVCVLGDGAWGTAVATVLAHNGYEVALWCHDDADAQAIAQTHRNERYLPGHALSELIKPTASLQEALRDVRWVFEAIPVQYMRATLRDAKPHITKDHVWVVLSKGIEQETLLLPTQIIDDVFQSSAQQVVLAGPSFAVDLAKKQVTGVSAAATNATLIREIQSVVENEYFKIFIQEDLIGVQVGGAVKNVMTLGVGMLDGAGYTDNTKSLLVTRGLSEMALIAKVLGGDPATLYGLSGVGDLVLTAMGNLSRNLAVGKRLGRGDALQTILDELGHVPEGINTVKSIKQLMEKKRLELPICSAIYDIVFTKGSINALITALF